MKKLTFAAVSRNYFNLPIWVAKHRDMFAEEGLDVAIELHEGVDEVTNRIRDGRARLGYGITEHVVLDSTAGGSLEIIGGNVNRLPFSFVTGKNIRTFEDLRGKTVGVSSIEAGSSSLVIKLLAARGLEYPRDYKLRAVGPILRAMGDVAVRRDRRGLAGRAAQPHGDRPGLSELVRASPGSPAFPVHLTECR